MRFFTSDTHFSHARIIELSGRPFVDYNHMDQQMIENFHAVMKPTDVLFHLGDVALGPIAESLPKAGRLPGRKMLIIGNHDRIFSKESQKKIERFRPEYDKYFEARSEQAMITLRDGTLVRLNHFPYEGDSHDADRHADMRPVDDGTILIHGHTHAHEKVSRSKRGTLMIHVGVDSWGFRPVSEEEIIRIIKDNS
jgi:calcineurin-like phosphoesterase family protein